MYSSYINELEATITKKENLALIKKIARVFYDTHEYNESLQFAIQAWKSPYFQIQEIAVFIFGYLAPKSNQALLFLKEEVVKHENWRVQETLAMAFDLYCKSIGYEYSLNIIHEWINCECDKNRRAVTEGLRTWTSRAFFRENPKAAISILSTLKEDESIYVRKSVGNALRDISKKHPDPIKEELATWDLKNKKILQVYNLAHKFIEKEDN